MRQHLTISSTFSLLVFQASIAVAQWPWQRIVNASLTVLALCYPLQAQTPDPLTFFPHHLGDIWEYTGVSPPHYVWQERILEDSIGPDGRYYVNHSYYGRLRIDTSSFEVRGTIGTANDYDILTYKLDADPGETWIRERGPQFVLIARIVGVYDGLFWGTVRRVKQIELSDSASGLLFLTDYLVSGLGLVGQDIDAFPDGRLTGAIIDGVQYGSITLPVREQDTGPPQSFALAQNYPNPFNSETIIQFSIPVGTYGHTSLRVYDVLGREVVKLVDGEMETGTHSVQFDASNMASGLYFYKLTAGRYTEVRKMVLMK